MTFFKSSGLKRHRRPELMLVGILLCSALYMWVRPYVGLRHDAQLYLGQTLFLSDPQGLIHDVFFVHGSQDRYSVASWILSEIYRSFGLAKGQFALLLAAQIALLAAAYRWIARFVQPRELWMGFVLLIVMQRLYGGHAIFAFGERFVTARTFSEPLLAWSLVLLAERRWVGSTACWVLGALAHPLMALPVLAVAWVRGVMNDWRWSWALAGVIPLLGLGALGLEPFAGLTRTYDPEWWSWIEKVSRHVLVGRWGAVDYMTLLVDGLVLAAAHRHLAFRRQWWAAVLLATGLLVLISLVLGDWARIQLIVQLQLWRVHWLAHMLALLCLPAVVLTLWRLDGSARVAGLALLAAVVGANSRSEETWPMLIWAALWLYASIRAWMPSNPNLLRLAAAVSVVMAAIGSLQGVLVNLDALGTPGLRTLGQPHAVLLILLLSTPALSLPLSGALLERASRFRGFAIVSAVGLLVAAAIGANEWDRRPSWTRYIEENYDRPHPWRHLIPVESQVYWHPSALPTWALLRRASFVSYEQGAGLLFNRGTAIDYGRRTWLLERISFQEQICKVIAALPGAGDEDFRACFPSEALITTVCTAKLAPDFLIFEKRLARGWVAEWTAQDPNGKPLYTFHLHNCAAYRN
ncbi:hypothetical protein [Inhella sp.]|uniref:hypothetical protein n=1 Tax=Inhella sp. TaxID=1921806 RepID=UPI0035B11E0E